MESIQETNATTITAFTLLAFGNELKLRIPLFLLFLLIYYVTITGNIIIIVLIVSDYHLHTPMYYFLGTLSCLETCYTSTLLPRMLVSFVTGDRTISVGGCFTQLYWFGSLVVAECYLFAAMSYDRYLAICRPLHYTVLMSRRLCFVLSAGSWLCGISVMTLVISLMSQLNYCGPNEIDHFFCELTPVINLACSDTTVVTLVGLTVSVIDTIPSFLLTMVSYVFIIATILRIPSSTGRKKTFSTCSSHLIVVSLFYGSLIFVYAMPKREALRVVDKVFSVFYTVLTPLANPLIYSLRNKEVKDAMRRMIHRYRFKVICSLKGIVQNSNSSK